MPYCQFISSPANAFFGSFPSDKELDVLVMKENVKVIVNLTEDDEGGIGIYEPPANTRVIKFPIKDNHAPEDWEEYAHFLLDLILCLRRGENMFVHCRAGHGRSGTVATSILCYLNTLLHPKDAIDEIATVHSKRDGLSAKWSYVFNPLSRVQQMFIYKFFSTIYLTRAYHTGNQRGFSSFSPHSVQLENGLTFPNAEAAFQYFRDPNDLVYVKKLQDSKKFILVKLIGDNHWSNARTLTCDEDEEMMYNIYKLKYSQNPSLVETLLKTGLRRIHDGYTYSHPNNLVGRVLMRLRENLLQ